MIFTQIKKMVKEFPEVELIKNNLVYNCVLKNTNLILFDYYPTNEYARYNEKFYLIYEHSNHNTELTMSHSCETKNIKILSNFLNGTLYFIKQCDYVTKQMAVYRKQQGINRDFE